MSRDTAIFFAWWIPLMLSIGWVDRFIREHTDATGGLTIEYHELCWLLALPAGLLLGIACTKADAFLYRLRHNA